MKKALSIFCALLLIFCCAACGAGTQENDASSASPMGEVTPAAQELPTTAVLEGFPWQIEVRNCEVRETLHTQAGLPQYDGSILDVDYDNAPSSGCCYLILTLTAAKTETGGSAFDWANFSVADAAGDAHSRMEDDTFLQNHQYSRMPSTSLQLGETKGSICFEIPQEQAAGPFTLQYDAGDAGILRVVVNPAA